MTNASPMVAQAQAALDEGDLGRCADLAVTALDDQKQQLQGSLDGLQNAGGGGKTYQEAYPETVKAASGYEAHGKDHFDLRSRAGREGLVCASPQVDNLPETLNDTRRCGAACVADALILDGGYQANAVALDKLSASVGYVPTQDQKAALAALKSGNMTPVNAAHLQELLYGVAREIGGTDNGGINPAGMMQLAGGLRSQGAFANSGSISFSSVQMPSAARPGETYNHWVVTVRDQKLYPTNVNPWPDKLTGGQTLTRSDEPADRGVMRGSEPNPTFCGRVDLLTDKDGTGAVAMTLPTRGWASKPPDRSQYAVLTAEIGKPPANRPIPANMQRNDYWTKTQLPVNDFPRPN